MNDMRLPPNDIDLAAPIDWARPETDGLQMAMVALPSHRGAKWYNLAWQANGAKSGTINGATWGPGHLSYDGINDYVTIGAVDNPTWEMANRFSVRVIFDPGSVAQYDVFACCCTSGGVGWRLWTRDASNFKYYWEVHDGGVKNTVSDSAIATGGTCDVTCVHDGSNLRLYVNGRPEGTPTAAGNVNYVQSGKSTRSLLGAMPLNDGATTFQRFGAGAFRLVSVYNRVLTPNEIAAAYVDPYRVCRRTGSPAIFVPAPGASVSIPETFAITDGVSIEAAVAVAETFAITDGVSIEAAVAVAETLTLTEALAETVDLTVADSLLIVDGTGEEAAVLLADALTLTDAVLVVDADASPLVSIAGTFARRSIGAAFSTRTMGATLNA